MDWLTTSRVRYPCLSQVSLCHKEETVRKSNLLFTDTWLGWAFNVTSLFRIQIFEKVSDALKTLYILSMNKNSTNLNALWGSWWNMYIWLNMESCIILLNCNYSLLNNKRIMKNSNDKSIDPEITLVIVQNLLQLIRVPFHWIGPTGWMDVPSGAVFLDLSLALRSHDQFQTSHWSILLSP